MNTRRKSGECETNEEAPPTFSTPPKLRPPYSQWLNDFAIASFGQQKKEKKSEAIFCFDSLWAEEKNKLTNSLFHPETWCCDYRKCLMQAVV